MSKIKLEEFYNNYLESLDEGRAALFVGAGMSQPTGFVNWKELMREIAEDLDLDVNKETDLIAVAQYHVNKYMGRTRLNKALIGEFTKVANLTDNHRQLALLPVHTVWTTNYDPLLEDAFHDANRRVDVKITSENLAYTIPQKDVTLYKMHGDISLPHEAVLTKEDYETYELNRAIFSTKLKGDLVEKTFLFLGFSFTDPNIEYILSRIRSLIGQENQREHYCIMRWPQPPTTGSSDSTDYEYTCHRMDLRIRDLGRYGIQTIVIDDYTDVTKILKELNHRSHRKNLFISGSAHEYAPLGRTRIDAIGKALGIEIIERGYNLVSGLGLGIGDVVILGAMEALYSDEYIDPNDRLYLHPFPQSIPKGMTKGDLYTKYRKTILSRSGIVIFLCGNKLDAASGETVIASGVLEEFNIAKNLGKYLIPIGASGHAAGQIWHEVKKSVTEFYPGGGVEGYFEILGDSNRTDEELVEAVFAIIDLIVPS